MLTFDFFIQEKNEKGENVSLELLDSEEKSTSENCSTIKNEDDELIEVKINFKSDSSSSSIFSNKPSQIDGTFNIFK